MTFSAKGSEVCNYLLFKAAHHNSLSLLKSAKRTYTLVELLDSLALCNEEGETPLLFAMKRQNVAAIDEFMTWLKEMIFESDECKLKVVEIIYQLSQRIPVIELVAHIIKDRSCTFDWLECCAQVVIKSTSLTRQDKINALELIGTCERLEWGLQYWRKAMTLRYFSQDSEPLPKIIPALCDQSVASSVIFGSAVEFTTMEELDLFNIDREQFRFQHLLVIRKICIQSNVDYPHWLYIHELLTLRSRFQLNPNRFPEDLKILININLLVLEHLDGFNPKLLPRQVFDYFIRSLLFLAKTFDEILDSRPTNPSRENLCYANLLASAKFITAIQCCHHFNNSDDHLHFSKIVYRFMFVLVKVSPRMTSQEKQHLEELYSIFIENSPKRKTTVLHVATSLTYFPYPRSNYVPHVDFDTFSLITKLGADRNAINEKGQTPLYILAENGKKLRRHFCWYRQWFQDLVDAETHLDNAADNGDTVVSILKAYCIQFDHVDKKTPAEESLLNYFKSLINIVFPLSCFAARVIRRNGIRFEDQLPPSLQLFVASHSAKVKTKLINYR